MTKNTTKATKTKKDTEKQKKAKVSKKVRKQIAQLNVMDDIFFHKIAEDRLACQEILRILMDHDTLILEEHHPQHSLKNLQGRSVILDALCKDSNHIHYDLEIQKSNNDNHQKRVRYISSLVTASKTPSGSRFKKVPSVVIIYISDFDLFGEGKTIYHIERTINETGTAVENGFSEIYVNTKIDDGSAVAELMRFFKNSVGYHEQFPNLSNRVRILKETEEGVKVMSEIVKKIREEGRREGRREGKREGRREGRCEGTFQSVIILVDKGVAKSEEHACNILNTDYHEFSTWKKKEYQTSNN